MPRTLLRLALVLSLLFAVSVPVGLADVVVVAPVDMQVVMQVDDAGDALPEVPRPEPPPPDVPQKLSRGVADTPAHPAESQRRVEAPERLESPLRQLVVASGPAPQFATSALGRLAVLTAAPPDSTAATPLHLRHCVFLC